MVIARGAKVLFSDADLSTPIEELDAMINVMEAGGYDMVIASRDLAESKLEVRQTWYRELAGKSFNLAVRLISGLPYRDTQCGFKLFTRKAARTIFGVARNNGFAFDVEALIIARDRGLSVHEQPVRWINAEGSKVHFAVDGPKMLAAVMGFRIAQIRGKYRASGQSD
jgi:dolichyl-phosphate beta-glucosyltransferase